MLEKLGNQKGISQVQAIIIISMIVVIGLIFAPVFTNNSTTEDFASAKIEAEEILHKFYTAEKEYREEYGEYTYLISRLKVEIPKPAYCRYSIKRIGSSGFIVRAEYDNNLICSIDANNVLFMNK